MKLELLISAVNAEPESLIRKMRVATDAVLINQCGRDESAEIKVDGGCVRVFLLPKRV